jgi:hypothetical protein
MDTVEKLLWLFKEVHGEMSGNCYTVVVYDEDENPIEVNVMKNGNRCWSASKADLVFDYITRHLDI